jgi:hypothetical protein
MYLTLCPCLSNLLPLRWDPYRTTPYIHWKAVTRETPSRQGRSPVVTPLVARLPDTRLAYKSVIRFSGDSKVPVTTCQLAATLWHLVVYGKSDFTHMSSRCSKHVYSSRYQYLIELRLSIGLSQLRHCPEYWGLAVWFAAVEGDIYPLKSLQND